MRSAAKLSLLCAGKWASYLVTGREPVSRSIQGQSHFLIGRWAGQQNMVLEHCLESPRSFAQKSLEPGCVLFTEMNPAAFS